MNWLDILPFGHFKWILLVALVELAFSWKLQWANYCLKETMATIGLRVVIWLSHGLTLLLIPSFAEWFYEHRLVTLPSSPSSITICMYFLVYEFSYYWAHRLSHENALGWGYHATHHSVTKMNLLGGLRLGAFGIFSFYTVAGALCFVLGFEPKLFFTVAAFGVIYQFLIHTELVPKLGTLEWVFVTPSNHRVHHGVQELYRDKNYGCTLIVFDRLFGTYQEELEKEKPIYGLIHTVAPVNPLRLSVIGWEMLFKSLSRFFGRDILLIICREKLFKPIFCFFQLTKK